jgi:hypothetical protein
MRQGFVQATHEPRSPPQQTVSLGALWCLPCHAHKHRLSLAGSFHFEKRYCQLYLEINIVTIFRQRATQVGFGTRPVVHQ